MSRIAKQHESNLWPRRVAIVLACATFPLIWVGGLVTTMDAGMSVPDWPSTYGYNLFLYPLSTWIGGPFDIFVEHGHRLLGSLVGLITIALVVVVHRYDARPAARKLAWICLAAVIGQGLIGGMRVVMNDVAFARLHGITGPMFFCLTLAMVAMTSSLWKNVVPVDDVNALKRLSVASCILTVLVLTQLVVGAHLRHLPSSMQPKTFSVIATGHIILAVGILLQATNFLLQSITTKVSAQARWVRPLATAITIFIVGQIALGVSTWLVKYGWPIWLPVGWFANFVVVEKSMLQALIITGHVALGSLILGSSLMFSLLGLRTTMSERSANRRIVTDSNSANHHMLEVAL